MGAVLKEEISPESEIAKEEDVLKPVIEATPAADAGPTRRHFLSFVLGIVRPSTRLDSEPESVWDGDDNLVIDLVPKED